MDIEAMKAAFAAKGGKVQVIEEGQGLGMTGRDWYKAVRGEQPSDNDLIAQRHVVVDHMGRERVRNGMGEWIA